MAIARALISNHGNVSRFIFLGPYHSISKRTLHASRGNQYQLLDWLEKLVFPAEAQFKDEHYARKMYKSVVRRVLDSGVWLKNS